MAPSAVRWRAVPPLCLVLAYPLTVHLSVTYGAPGWGAALLALLLALTVAYRWRRGDSIAVVIGLAAAFAALLVLSGGDWMLLLYTPPVLIHAVLCWLFLRSLSHGRTPVISRLAAVFRGHLSPAVAAYTRTVTQVWAVYFGLMAVQGIVLALYAPPWVWSLFTNGVNYALTLALLLAEYAVRRIVLRHEPHMAATDYLRRLRHCNLRMLTGDGS